MITRGVAKLQGRRNKTKQFPTKQDASSSAGKKRAALTDVTNQLTVKHPAYHKEVVVSCYGEEFHNTMFRSSC